MIIGRTNAIRTTPVQSAKVQTKQTYSDGTQIATSSNELAVSFREKVTLRSIDRD